MNALTPTIAVTVWDVLLTWAVLLILFVVLWSWGHRGNRR